MIPVLKVWISHYLTVNTITCEYSEEIQIEKPLYGLKKTEKAMT